MSLLDDVRANARQIMDNPRFVRIAEDRLDAYAAGLPLEQARAPELDPTTHYLGDPEATRAYVISLDAINFGSGYFPHLQKRRGMSGYFTVASSLKDRFDAQGPFSPDELQALDAAACCRIFGQTTADPDVLELMGLFARALNDLGAVVAREYGGSWSRLVDASDGSAEHLAEILAGMPFFDDRGFYKRAQLTAADLCLARVAEFRDLDRLTIFADNLVPHVLRLDGVLVYQPDLVERIERAELIPKGSTEELEIRAGALHAVERIAARFRERGDDVTPMMLDYILWNRGQTPDYKARPRHRTRTVFY